MTVYHRYIIANGNATTIEELQQGLQEVDPRFNIDGDAIVFKDTECGIIDVTNRGNPIFDGDIDLLTHLAEKSRQRNEIRQALSDSRCMVTVQPISTAYETAFDLLWEWLRINREGILAYEGGHFRIDA